MAKEPSNPYTGSAVASELVQIVLEFYKTHRNQFTATEATNIGTTVTNILNGTNKV